MIIPCIVITRDQPSAYQWAVVHGAEAVDIDVGESSIEGCLRTALVRMPGAIRLVEIRYRGIHMGTFSRARIDDVPSEIATIVAETYGVLIGDS